MVNWRQLPQFCLILLLLVLLIANSTVAQSKIELKINHEVKVTGQKLQLGEIAKIEASQKAKEQLENIDLGQAPLPGYTRVLKRDYILSALQRAGFDFSRIAYQIPKQIRLTTPHQVLDTGRLKEKVRNYIQQNLSAEAEDIEIEIQKLNREVRLPVGEVELQIGDVNTEQLLGRTSVPVNIYVDGELAKKKYVRAQVNAQQKVLVAKESIKRHQSLSQSQFKWEKRLLTRMYNQPFTDLDSIQDYKLKRRINNGQILTKNLIEIPPLVERRDKVTIIAIVGRVKVSTVGIAQEAGAEGEIIKVKNIKSDEEIMAKIIDEKTVKVLL